MSRRCERPGCSADATVAYGFSTERLLAWLGPLADGDRNATGALCERHADAMVPPRGWWLDDRRTDEPTLFRAREHRSDPPERRGHGGDDGRRRPARRPHELAIGEQLALDAEVVGVPDGTAPTPETDGAIGSAAPEPVEPAPAPASAEPPAEPWTPSFDVTDDLGGLLDASTPLLARAFGRSRRSTTRPAPGG
jgi:hypothetical protein